MYGAWVLAVRLILVILSLRFFYVDYREGGSFFKMETYSNSYMRVERKFESSEIE